MSGYDRITYCDVVECCETCPRYGDDCDGEFDDEGHDLEALPSAEAESSLKAIKRQIDEHWYLDPPSAETPKPTGDLISRADAIEAVAEDLASVLNVSKDETRELAEHALSALQSASQNLLKPNNGLQGSDLISRDVVLANIDERLRANGYENVGLVSELNRLFGYVRNIPSADAVPQLNRIDTLIIAGALRYLAEDEGRHPSDRARAEILRGRILQYGASMCKGGDDK